MICDRAGRGIAGLARAALTVALGVALAVALACGSAAAQNGGGAPPAQPQTAAPTHRPAGGRPEVLEIRAQAPVPQVVTVRPRVLPTFPASALDTTFIDRGFESALRTPYSIVPPPLPPPAPGASPPVAPAPAASSPLQHAPPQER